MNQLKKDFASRLLKVKAIKLQPNNPFIATIVKHFPIPNFAIT